ncbi:ABC transporter ATP-binding protein [Paenibacillus sp. CAA11]|uniref:ABC transporter ATP-binding protein n=1 Tax=Paenibacillus sp. CAA11 TaxID=1532905 RepID=UPI0018FF91A2|nr:ABC transporter ATP-binding protein [Paenibacillus sp. CAA11]
MAIQTKNLTKKFRNKTAVNGLNLTINHGELYTLLGVNGAGKTTTIKMLTCLSKPTSGDAMLLGDSIASSTYNVKEKINVSPQETAVARNLSVKENLEFIARIYGFDKKDIAAKVQEMLSTFKLEDYSRDKAKTLSGGLQRRLSIAMALISDPKILFLDEPTLGLDVLARRELWTAIEKLKGEVTIILTTHYMEEAQALSDRVGIMAKGELKAVGTVAELMAMTNTKTLEDAFVSLAAMEEDKS